ncbi:hypothetical protein FACS1894137_02980 [Spirochaetia bacterium]|nr:hypothetical protein FACS1894137_02980 [Spirochaetia bacterium]
MYGILNALALANHDVYFISNVKIKNKFNKKIVHIPINYDFTVIQKRLLQGLLSIFPACFVYILYKKLFIKIKKAFAEVNLKNEPVIFFQYLDTSIAYILKKKNIIRGYINDVEGIGPTEFSSMIKYSNNIKTKLIYSLKYIMSVKLDHKIFNNGDGYIYASEKMKNFYGKIIKGKQKPKSYIIPYVLDETIPREVDKSLKLNILKKYTISSDEFVFLFSGSYKATSGIEDLISAFNKINSHYKNTKLIIICGYFTKYFPGEQNKNIIIIEGIPYEQLFTYQSIAHVIVCPDRMNPFSNMIVHVKYFDALISGKLVICGSFASVKELNKEDCLSLSFEPSNVDSLYAAMNNTIDNYDILKNKYEYVSKYANDNLTYLSYMDLLGYGRD